jgi:Myb-like DNA-binding domain
VTDPHAHPHSPQPSAKRRRSIARTSAFSSSAASIETKLTISRVLRSPVTPSRATKPEARTASTTSPPAVATVAAARATAAAAASAAAARSRSGRRDGYTRFTSEEEALLVEGVRVYGVGNWKLILASSGKGPGSRFHPRRTPVDLKDKWRNLSRARQRKVSVGAADSAQGSGTGSGSGSASAGSASVTGPDSQKPSRNECALTTAADGSVSAILAVREEMPAAAAISAAGTESPASTTTSSSDSDDDHPSLSTLRPIIRCANDDDDDNGIACPDPSLDRARCHAISGSIVGYKSGLCHLDAIHIEPSEENIEADDEESEDRETSDSDSDDENGKDEGEIGTNEQCRDECAGRVNNVTAHSYGRGSLSNDVYGSNISD